MFVGNTTIKCLRFVLQIYNIYAKEQSLSHFLYAILKLSKTHFTPLAALSMSCLSIRLTLAILLPKPHTHQFKLQTPARILTIIFPHLSYFLSVAYKNNAFICLSHYSAELIKRFYGKLGFILFFHRAAYGFGKLLVILQPDNI